MPDEVKKKSIATKVKEAVSKAPSKPAPKPAKPGKPVLPAELVKAFKHCACIEFKGDEETTESGVAVALLEEAVKAGAVTRQNVRTFTRYRVSPRIQ